MDFIFPPPQTKNYSKVIYASDGTLLTAFLTEDHKWRMRTNIEDVSPDLIKAILVKEDKNFFFHFGVDFTAIFRAIIYNIFTKGKISGASTITMQVVRILEPKPRSYLNKIIEVIRAFQFELHHSKKEVLSIYLSHLPLGGNIEGIKSASYIYFNHHPKTLSISQAILISVIPGNPNQLRLDRINDKIKSKRDYWIHNFIKQKIFPNQLLLDAQAEPIEAHRYAVPKISPQFCYYLKKRSYTEIDEIYSTLNLKIQTTVEDILLNYVNRIRSRNISNGVALVIDNKNSSVVGYCASANFKDKRHQGEVNGILAVRSPGSTLKPALYAEAFEMGFLTPGTKILDVPIEIGGFEPENFDSKFNGFVSAEFALVNSLNISSVILLNQIGVKNFSEILNSINFKTISKQKDKLGLSMILGGCGVTAEEMGKLYSVFGNQGVSRSLAYTTDQLSNQTEIRVFDKETCYLISEILSGLKRNDNLKNIDFSKLPKFAWKTGTSYGKHDAWAIGFNTNYTIVVWVGNFDGEASPFLTGAGSALPLLAELFNAIDYNPKQKWFDKPGNIYEREVCAVSGLLPNDFCGARIKELAVKNKSHNVLCNIHQEVFVNQDETIQYCRECLPDTNYKRKVYTVFEPELVSYYKKNNISVDIIPDHNPFCIALFSNGGPKILSPSGNFEYFIESEDPQEIVFLAADDPKNSYYYWYVDNELTGKLNNGEKLFYKLKVGKHKITCLDNFGKSSSVIINVKEY
jgi:penicillin-binding protein 1C